MNYRTFGRSEIQVSELVFGGGWVGGILIHRDDETKREALRRALRAGVNWIDTAPSYGQGQSEQALGWLLKEVEAQPYLSTKVGLDVDHLGDIRGQVEQSLEESLHRLQRDSVDLLQLHNPIALVTGGRAVGVEEVLRKEGLADAFDRLRDQGLIRLTGITALGDAAACCQVIDSGRFDSAQVYYNLLNPSAGQPVPAGWSGHDFKGVIAACRRQDVAIMCIRVFAAGILATDVRHGREVMLTEGTDVATEEARARAVFAELGAEYGSPAQTALRFALGNPHLSCIVIGLAELEHLDEALAAAEMGPLPEGAIHRIRRLQDSDFGRL